MPALRPTAFLFVLVLSGCSMFHHDEPAPGQGPSKKFSLLSLGNRGPQDASEFLEYQREHPEKDKAVVALSVRNTHPKRGIEGDIRTTIETGVGQSKVDNTHFSLGPNEVKKLLVYPTSTHLIYEVTAVFKE